MLQFSQHSFEICGNSSHAVVDYDVSIAQIGLPAEWYGFKIILLEARQYRYGTVFNDCNLIVVNQSLILIVCVISPHAYCSGFGLGAAPRMAFKVGLQPAPH